MTLFHLCGFISNIPQNYFPIIHGHNVGDEVLKILVSRMRNAVRRGTVIAGYGGEEFIVMLPGIGSKGAEEVALRINRTIAATPFSVDSLKLQISASVGVCSKKDESPLLEIIDNVGAALYTAKNSGRNTVVSCTELGSGSCVRNASTPP